MTEPNDSQRHQYRTFDRGEWGYTQLRDKGLALLEAIREKERALRCGHWRLWLADGSAVAAFEWCYVVGLEILGTDRHGGPVLFETVLVTDLPSLLALFTLLRAADVETAEVMDSDAWMVQ